MAYEPKMNTSLCQTWETPQWLFDRLDEQFHFTLDAAADDYNHKCDEYFTEKDNALCKKWVGVIFCNPPYGKQIGKWVKKAWEESQDGATVVMLIPARTDTSWFHDYCTKGEITFIRKRVRFSGATVNAPFPSMIVVFNGERAMDCEAKK